LSGTLDARDLADLPRADRLAGALGVFAGPRLRADLHDPLESPGHVDHPAPFADEQVARTNARRVRCVSARGSR
jgi:hypothetical protein